MKLIVIVGSEAHTTSRASARLEYVAADNTWTQTPKTWNQKWEPQESGRNANWYQLELDVPAGTRLRYKCSGNTGPRGVNKHDSIIEFKMDEAAEVLEETPDIGLRNGFLKGRARRLKTTGVPVPINVASGF